VEVSASAIRHNVESMKALIDGLMLCCVVKADAYGHGATLVARTALEAGADWLGVAIIDEGIELRESGVGAPILVQAESVASALQDGLANSLTLTIGSVQGAVDFVACAEKLGGLHKVHVKVDTGMHRMGVDPSDVDTVVNILQVSKNVDLEGLFTHFSVADGASGEDRAFTRKQIELFNEIAESLQARGACPRVLHLANSAGAMAYPASRQSMVRSGLAIYGLYTQAWLANALEEKGLHLKTAMTVKAHVSAVRRLEAGGRPSYGRRRALERTATVATVPFGYADGYPRRLFDAGAQVLINNTRYELAGVVTMDQLVIDCGDDPVSVGDEVVLLGRQGNEEISAEELAELAGTITHEIICGFGARVPRVLVD
jgi:alanine racemase